MRRTSRRCGPRRLHLRGAGGATERRGAARGRPLGITSSAEGMLGRCSAAKGGMLPATEGGMLATTETAGARSTKGSSLRAGERGVRRTTEAPMLHETGSRGGMREAVRRSDDESIEGIAGVECRWLHPPESSSLRGRAVGCGLRLTDRVCPRRLDRLDGCYRDRSVHALRRGPHDDPDAHSGTYSERADRGGCSGAGDRNQRTRCL